MVYMLPGGTIQLTSQGGQGEPPGLHTITSGSGGTIVQYSTGQDSHIYVPGKILKHIFCIFYNIRSAQLI